MKLAKEAKVGILAITAIVIFYIGFNFLKGIDFFSSTNRYYTVFKSIGGLKTSNPVMLSGLSVGRVSDITILQDQNNGVLVAMDVNDNIRLGKGSEAVLSNIDILGSQAIVLHPQNIDVPMNEEDTLKGSVEASISKQIQEKALPVVENLDSISMELGRILKTIADNDEGINRIIQNVDTSTQSLKRITTENAANIHGTMRNLNLLSNSLQSQSANLEQIIANSAAVTDSLKEANLKTSFMRMDTTLAQINQVLYRLNDGEGSIDKLMDDDSLYVNLSHSLKSMDALLQDLKEHPKRYVHFSLFGGKKDKK